MEIREIGEDELATLVALMRAAQPRVDETVSGFVDWRNQAAAMTWLLGERDGEAVAGGYALSGWHTPPQRGIALAVVHPDARGSGAGTAILRRVEAWARERGLSELDGAVAEDDPESIAWAGRKGYVEAGRNSRLVLDLTAIDAPAQAAPEGIEIVSWAERPELSPGLFAVAREAVPDIPGEEEDDIGTMDEWLARDMGGAGDDPRAVFVALAGDEVAGFAKLSLSAENRERAFHDLTGVLRSHRGRGIAAALKRTQISWAKDEGYTSLATMNETRNEPIRRLNERHGYAVEPGSVIVRGSIAAT